MRFPELEQAHQILRDAVAGVAADQWSAPTPCSEWTVAQVTEHAALDQLLYVAALTDGPKPTADAFHPAGDLPGGADLFVGRALDASRAAFDAIAPDAEVVAVPLPPFTLSPAEAAGAAALDAAIHGWDIAVATGQRAALTEDLAHELLAVAHQLADPVRAWGAYAAAIAPVPDSDYATCLLNYLGRQVNWAAQRGA